MRLKHLKPRKVLLLNAGFSRKIDPKGWYEHNKDHINRLRRMRRAKRKEHFNAKNKDAYQKHGHKYFQNTEAGKALRKLKRHKQTIAKIQEKKRMLKEKEKMSETEKITRQIWGD